MSASATLTRRLVQLEERQPEGRCDVCRTWHFAVGHRDEHDPTVAWDANTCPPVCPACGRELDQLIFIRVPAGKRPDHRD